MGYHLICGLIYLFILWEIFHKLVFIGGAQMPENILGCAKNSFL